ncbi:MAG: hypothetical protein WBE29_17255, partial [Pseudolabrys sp.]
FRSPDWARAGSMAGGAARAATVNITTEQMRGAIKSRLFRLAGVSVAGSNARLTRGIRRWKGDQVGLFTTVRQLPPKPAITA